MKKTLTLAGFFLFFSSFVIAQYSFPSKQAKYGILTSYGPGGGVQGSSYGLNLSEIEINGLTYLTNEHFYARFSENKVLILNPDSLKEEYVLYDFNLEVGNKFKLPLGALSLDLPPSFDDEIVVTSKKQILMNNGEYRNEITFDNGTVWIEGIGDIKNNFYYLDQINLFDIHSSISCYWEGQVLIYKSASLECSCDDIDTYTKNSTSINIVNDVNVAIAPNPISSVLRIESVKNIIKTEVYNSLGVLVLNSTQRSIDCSSLSTGIYYAKIYDDNKNVYLRSVLKK